MACFKLHKESLSCEKKPIPNPDDEPDSNPQSLIYVDPEDDEESVVPREDLERLGKKMGIGSWQFTLDLIMGIGCVNAGLSCRSFVSLYFLSSYVA